MLDVAVIIVSWNVRDYLVDCLRSVYKEICRSKLRAEVWVVDNNSTDGTVDLVQSLFPALHVIANEENRGFGAANNQGMRAAAELEPAYYFLLNPDTLLRPDSLTHLVQCLEERPNAGMAGARLVYRDGRFQPSAFYFPGLTQLTFDLFPMPARLYESRLNGRYALHQFQPDHKPFPIDHPLGATMLVRASVAKATAGFDESYHMYCEEIDWSWRIRKGGWDIYAVPAAEVVHLGGQSTKQVPAQSVLNLWRSRAQLYAAHHGRLRKKLATHLVRLGMRRKATQTTDPQLKQAYEEIVHIWTNGRTPPPTP